MEPPTTASLLRICPFPGCQSQFSSDYKLYLHNLLNHQSRNVSSNKWTCNYNHCPYAHRHRFKIKQHLTQHFDVFPYECRNCDYKCKVYSTFQAHIKAHHSNPRKKAQIPKNFTCKNDPNCLKTFSSDYELNLHLISEHQVRNSQGKYSCVKCNYVSSKRFNVSDHLSTHYPNVFPFSCGYCSYKCNFRRTLQSHILRVHRCKKSKKLKNVEPFLMATTSTTTTDQPSFETSSLKVKPILHISPPAASTPKILSFFSCTHLNCSKSFRTEFQSKLHGIIEHRPEETYQCTDCDYKTDLPSKIETHLKRHFNMEDETSQNQKFKCSMCQETFTRTSSLNRHKRNSIKCGNFQNPIPINLPMSENFQNQSITNLIKNELTKMFPTPKLLSCKYCPHKVKSTSGLYKHLAKCHPKRKLNKNGTLKKGIRKRKPIPPKFDTNTLIKMVKKQVMNPPPQNLIIQNVGVSSDPFDFQLPNEREIEEDLWSESEPPPSPLPEEESPLILICLHRRCQLKYETQFEFDVHQILDHLPPHLNEFECSYCRMVVEVDNTEEHLLDHLVPTIYECKTCEYESYYKDYMDKHNSQIHPIGTTTAPTEDPEIEFECTVCNLSFDSETGLDFHASEVHHRVEVDAEDTDADTLIMDQNDED